MKDDGWIFFCTKFSSLTAFTYFCPYRNRFSATSLRRCACGRLIAQARPGLWHWKQWEKDRERRQVWGYIGLQPKGKWKFRLVSLGKTVKMRIKLNALLLGALSVSSLVLGCRGSQDPQ
jgi:hypothetical protein